MEITGKLHLVTDTQTIKDTFKKREVILEYIEGNPDYPQLIKLEFTQDNCSMLDGYKPGEDVKVLFNLRGRKWTNPKGEDVYFNTLQAWRIERTSGTQNSPAAPVDAEMNQEPASDDDLPF